MKNLNQIAQPIPTINENEPSKAQGSGAEIIINLEGLIKGHTENITNLKEEKKKKSDFLRGSYEGNPAWRELDEKAKELRKQATVLKKQTLNLPSNKVLAQEVKDLKGEIKESENALSDYLVEYARIAQVTQLELFPGEIGEIKLSAKLLKKAKI